MGQINARSETQIANLRLNNDSLQANIQEHKDEIKSLRQRIDSLYDRHRFDNHIMIIY